jgi:CHASE3 domain sensor protein
VKAISERIVAAGFGLAILLLCGVSIASYFSIQNLIRNKQWVIHTYEVIGAIDNAIEALSEEENARRGYLITQRHTDLDTYQASVQRVIQTIEQIRQLTANTPSQQQRLDLLEPLLNQRFALLNQSVNLLKQNELEMSEKIALTERGGAIQQEIKSRLQTLKTEEYALLQERSLAAETSFHTIVLVVCIGYFFSLILLIWVYCLLKQQLRINKSLSKEAIRLVVRHGSFDR